MHPRAARPAIGGARAVQRARTLAVDFDGGPYRAAARRGEVGAPAAAHAADVRAVLERRGEMIGEYDLLIAGHARSRGLVVVTGTLGEFSRVDGLLVEDWLP